MKEQNDNLEIEGDLRDEYAAIQEAEEGNEPELVTEEDLRELLQSVWDELITQPKEEEYTEEDAFRDFIADQQEDWN